MIAATLLTPNEVLLAYPARLETDSATVVVFAALQAILLGQLVFFMVYFSVGRRTILTWGPTGSDFGAVRWIQKVIDNVVNLSTIWEADDNVIMP